PETLPVTEETRERLRAQANQLGESTVIRLVDLLAVAVEDMRQGGDPRLPLELALVKVTRPGADLSRESIAYRLERLEQAAGAHPPLATSSSASASSAPSTPPPSAPTPPSTNLLLGAEASAPPSLELEQLQEAWRRTILP